MPQDNLSAIGARSPWRDRCYELKQLFERPKNIEKLPEMLARTDLNGLDGEARFAFVVDALVRKKPSDSIRAPKQESLDAVSPRCPQADQCSDRGGR